RREDSGERAGFAPEDLGLEILEPALVRLRDLLQTLPQLGEGCQEVAHGQRACFATSANCWNAAGSRTARSASTLRLISTPARRSPFIRRLYESWCSRAAALMRMIQRRRKSPFWRRRSRWAHFRARSTDSVAACQSWGPPPKYLSAGLVTCL